MVKTNTNWYELSDASIMERIGHFIKRTRQDHNFTQAQLADRAGLNRWTISQIENGESVNMTSLIQILRALNSLYVLNQFEVSDQISPIEYAKLKRKQRQRVRNDQDPSKDKEGLEW